MTSQAPLIRLSSDEDPWNNGWRRHSGALASLDTDAPLLIVGREKELITRGGHNVVPGEFEAALFEDPAATATVVAGIRPSRPERGRGDTSFEGPRGPPKRLAADTTPRRITVVEMLPRNESGKVIESRLEPGVPE